MPAELLLNAVQAQGASDERTVGGFDTVFIQIWSAAGSDATVLIECRADVTGSPWFTAATVVNPTATGGRYYSVPSTGKVRVNVSIWTSGAISASLEGNRTNL